MAVVITFGGNVPVNRIARVTGQYAKYSSTALAEVDGV